MSKKKTEPASSSKKNTSSKKEEKKTRGIKVRLYPTKEQITLMEISFGIDRFIYNYGLNIKKNLWNEKKESISWQTISKNITQIKKNNDEYKFLNVPSRSVIDQSLMKMDDAYQGFFKQGKGFPKFKKKGKCEDSFILTDPTTMLKNNKIKLPKLGVMKIRGLRKFEGRIKNVTIKKNKAGQHFATFVMEDVEKFCNPKLKTNSTKSIVGIDVNLENFLTDSNGNRIENPRIKKTYINKIKFYQREMSKLHRKTRRKNDESVDNKHLPIYQSRKYQKIKLKHAQIYNKITNKKQDFLHKLSMKYIKNHDVIIVEELKIQNMLKNHNLAESIAQVGWGEFFRQLEYKSKWYGSTFIKVKPHNTTKTCNKCNFVNNDLTLKDREWICPQCKNLLNRDENSAKNIKNKGIGSVLKASGGTELKFYPNTRDASISEDKIIFN